MDIDLSFIFEISVSLLAFIIPISKKKRGYFRFLLSLLLFCGIAILLQSIPYTSDLLKRFSSFSFISGILYFSIILVLAYLMVVFTCDTDLYEALFILFMAFTTQHLAYCFRFFVEGITNKAITNTDSGIYLFSHVAFAIASYYIVARPMSRNGHYRISAYSSFLIAFGVLTVVLIMSPVSARHDFVFYHSIYAMLCCCFILFSARSQIIQQNIRDELAIKEELWNKKKMQYELSKETIAVVNQNYHDMKHKIAAINLMSQEEDRKKALQAIEDNIAMYDTVVHTENEILDTILTEKRMICENNSIPMSCICDGNCVSFMEILDLYTLLGNALDNAIEANQKVETDSRFINVRIKKQKGIVMIEIINPLLEVPVIENGEIITSKSDKNSHGFGMRSMKEIVAKYDGIIDYKVEKNCFNLRIIFQDQ